MMTWVVDAALCAFWIVSLAVVALRRVSEHVRQVSQYGGRTITPQHNESHGWRAPAVIGWLFHALVPRRVAFTAFYATGIATCAALIVAFRVWHAVLHRPIGGEGAHDTMKDHRPPGVVELLPLLLFCLHCGVRCCETVYRQQFRVHGDVVTVFAAMSGCGFYCVAAMSAVSWSAVASGSSGAEEGTVAVPSSFSQAHEHAPLAVLAVAAHLMLQGLQVWHHEILRSMRVAAPCHPAARTKAKPSPPAYQYPAGRGLFAYVQEPHYMCEVLLYVVQWLYTVAVQGSELQLWYHWPWPSLLVAVFTCANLVVTATDHAAYWQSTTQRKMVPRWKVLPLLV